MRNAEEEAHPVTRCEGVRLVQRSDGLLRMSGHTPRHRHSQRRHQRHLHTPAIAPSFSRPRYRFQPERHRVVACGAGFPFVSWSQPLNLREVGLGTLGCHQPAAPHPVGYRDRNTGVSPTSGGCGSPQSASAATSTLQPGRRDSRSHAAAASMHAAAAEGSTASSVCTRTAARAAAAAGADATAAASRDANA
jgi:hypothetical protein